MRAAPVNIITLRTSIEVIGFLKCTLWYFPLKQILGNPNYFGVAFQASGEERAADVQVAAFDDESQLVF